MGSAEAELVRHLAELSSFPSEAIDRWIQRSGEFSEMFEEYTQCRGTATDLRAALAHDQRGGEESEGLSRRLEAEMLQFLRDHSAEGTG